MTFSIMLSRRVWMHRLLHGESHARSSASHCKYADEVALMSLRHCEQDPREE